MEGQSLETHKTAVPREQGNPLASPSMSPFWCRKCVLAIFSGVQNAILLGRILEG